MRLVIAEKPSVGQSIAKVIGATISMNGYMEGNGYLVSWCLGHLVELAPPEEYGEAYKKWNKKDLPIIPEKYQYEILENTKATFCRLKKLMHDERVTEIIEATDAGREGELIFRLVYEKAGCHKPILRLWISSMEDAAIKEGFAHLQPGDNYISLFQAAQGRSWADWLIGMNGTRLFTTIYGTAKPLHVGRVSTPTLAMIVKRSEDIKNFVKTPYFKCHIITDSGIDAVSAAFTDKEDALNIARACQGKEAKVSKIEKEEKSSSAPKLYDLTALQRDANKYFSLTAVDTLQMLQNLYEKKLCTYPRTDSRFLTEDMEDTARNVIAAIQKVYPFARLGQKEFYISQVMNSKKVTDHHAVIPTVQIQNYDIENLPSKEKIILALVSQRLLAACSGKEKYISIKVELECEGYFFQATGKTILEKGFRSYETAFQTGFKAEKETDEKEEAALPQIEQGNIYADVTAKVSEHTTKPQPLYTDASILAAMEKAGVEDMAADVERKGIGTPASRADIIENLVKRGYVKRVKKNLVPTARAAKLISVLPDLIKSPKMTADWENRLADIAKGKENLEEFMTDIEQMVKNLIVTYSEVTKEGIALFQEEKMIVLGKCPKCGADISDGQYGPYCTSNPRCGMVLNRWYGNSISGTELQDLLAGKTITKKVKSQKGDKYSCRLTYTGFHENQYNGNITYQMDLKKEYVQGGKGK